MQGTNTSTYRMHMQMAGMNNVHWNPHVVPPADFGTTTNTTPTSHAHKKGHYDYVSALHMQSHKPAGSAHSRGQAILQYGLDRSTKVAYEAPDYKHRIRNTRYVPAPGIEIVSYY